MVAVSHILSITANSNRNFFSFSTDNMNGTFNETEIEDPIRLPSVQSVFYIIYTNIFVLGMCGNMLTVFVVFRNRDMQTVTNFFIANLALADILLCTLCVPFTPLYTFSEKWVFGMVMCHIVAFAQGTSVYVSTLTLTSIAVDRFFVIIYPFKRRMKTTTCLCIILGTWLVSILSVLPYGIIVMHESHPNNNSIYFCEEKWPSPDFRKAYGGVTFTLQFVLPFLIIAICYIKISIRLNEQTNARPGVSNPRREANDRCRKQRTNRMLIAMVLIFGLCWLPLNCVNIFYDFNEQSEPGTYYNLFFFIVHVIAMSSTCYNPFLYSWLNENFRKEFKLVLPGFHGHGERRCNGNETVQDSLLTTMSVVRRSSSIVRDRRPERPVEMTKIAYNGDEDRVEFIGTDESLLLRDVDSEGSSLIGGKRKPSVDQTDVTPMAVIGSDQGHLV